MLSASFPTSPILSISHSLSSTELQLSASTTTITPPTSKCNSHNNVNNHGVASTALTLQTTSSRSPTTTPSYQHIKYFGDGSYPSHIILTVTRPTGTYTTIVPLGNSFPTDTSDPTASPPQTTAKTPGIPTSSIVGIIVGCILAFGMLAGVFYVYALRAKRYRYASTRGGGSSRKTVSTGTRSRRSRRSSSGAGGPPGGVFPPVGEP